MRISEVVGLNRGDFDPTSGKVRIVRQAADGGSVRQTKTRNERNIRPLGPGLELLHAHVASHPMLPNAPMFTGVRGGRLSTRMLREEWNRARAEVGLDDLHFHDVKRVSMTVFAATAPSLSEFKARSGHKTVAMLARYVDNTDERQAELVERANERLRGIL